MNRLSRLGIVLLIAVTLATPSAFADSPSVAVPFWSFLTSLWAKNGCQVDPNGRCLPRPIHAADNGCSADPDGRCLPLPSQAAADNGCSADPNGRCSK